MRKLLSLPKIVLALVGLAAVSVVGVGVAVADGTVSFPAYTRIQDGASTPVAGVGGSADGYPQSTPGLVTQTFGYGFNGTTWDRLRSDPGSGVLRTTTGGATTATIAAATAGPTVIKNGAGRIDRMLITTAGTASETFYDNASACSGTIIAVTPPTTTVGQVIDFSMPAANGVTGCGGAGSPAVTVSYN